MKTFIGFPYKLYRSESNWVPPLRITQSKLFSKDYLFWRKNPHSFFLAYRDGRCVGRIAAFVNHAHNDFLKTREGFFGYLEAEHDPEIFEALTTAAIQFCRVHHCASVSGPMNPDIHNELGVLIKGFDAPPYMMLTYNYEYYDASLQHCGFTKLKDFYAYPLKADQYVATQAMQRIADRLVATHELHIRTPDMKKFSQELEHFHDIYNDAFSDHWGFVPIPKDEFLLLAQDMKDIIDPRIVLIVEYSGKPIAFLLCLPNINEILQTIRNGRLFPSGLLKILLGKKHIGSARVITAAVKKEYQYLGIGAILYPEIMKRALRYGYPDSELSWVVEDNLIMNSLAEKLSGPPSKTYRLYHKEIDASE